MTVRTFTTGAFGPVVARPPQGYRAATTYVVHVLPPPVSQVLAFSAPVSRVSPLAGLVGAGTATVPTTGQLWPRRGA